MMPKNKDYIKMIVICELPDCSIVRNILMFTENSVHRLGNTVVTALMADDKPHKNEIIATCKNI
jgi:hypothetical protein